MPLTWINNVQQYNNNNKNNCFFFIIKAETVSKTVQYFLLFSKQTVFRLDPADTWGDPG